LILIGLLLLLPGVGEFNQLILYPLSTVFGQPEGLIGAWAAAAFVSVAMLWAGLHRDAIAYPPAAGLLASLPISRQALLARDLLVLALVSLPLLTLLGVALVVSQPLGIVHKVLVLLTLLLATATAQLAVIRKAVIWGAVAIVSAVIAGGTHRADILPIMVLANLLALWKMPGHVLGKTGDYRQARFITGFRRDAISWTELHWRSIYQSAHGGYRLCLVLTLSLTALAVTLCRLTDTPMHELGVLLAHGALMSGLYGLSFPTALSNQAAYRAFLTSLPTGRFRRMVDMVVAVEFPAMLLGLGASCFASQWLIAALALFVTALLCCIQYLTYQRLPRHAVVIGLATAIIIIVLVLNIALFTGVL
jgi:hypothetical protein